jgi:hypothetical protein
VGSNWQDVQFYLKNIWYCGSGYFFKKIYLKIY